MLVGSRHSIQSLQLSTDDEVIGKFNIQADTSIAFKAVLPVYT